MGKRLEGIKLPAPNTTDLMLNDISTEDVTRCRISMLDHINDDYTLKGLNILQVQEICEWMIKWLELHKL
jgi:hypothetical protein